MHSFAVEKTSGSSDGEKSKSKSKSVYKAVPVKDEDGKCRLKPYPYNKKGNSVRVKDLKKILNKATESQMDEFLELARPQLGIKSKEKLEAYIDDHDSDTAKVKAKTTSCRKLKVLARKMNEILKDGISGADLVCKSDYHKFLINIDSNGKVVTTVKERENSDSNSFENYKEDIKTEVKLNESDEDCAVAIPIDEKATEESGDNLKICMPLEKPSEMEKTIKLKVIGTLKSSLDNSEGSLIEYDGEKDKLSCNFRNTRMYNTNREIGKSIKAIREKLSEEEESADGDLKDGDDQDETDDNEGDETEDVSLQEKYYSTQPRLIKVNSSGVN